MSRALMSLVTAVVAILALLALDDITTGNEPTFWQEWTMVSIAGLWLAVIVVLAARRDRSA